MPNKKFVEPDLSGLSPEELQKRLKGAKNPSQVKRLNAELAKRGQGGTGYDPNQSALEKLYGKKGNEGGNALINKFAQEGSFGRFNTGLQGAQEEQDRTQGLVDKYANPSAAQQEALQKMQAGLGGYTSPEMQGMREQNEAAQNSNFATASGQLAKAQARGRVYGAAAQAGAANLNTANINSKNDQAQKLMIANADEQQKRLGAYGQYGNQVQAQQFAAQNTLNQAQNDLGKSQRGESLDREKLNMGQSLAEKTAQIGLYTGAAGTAVQQASQAKGDEMQQQGINAVTGAKPKEEANKPAQQPAKQPVKQQAQKNALKKMGKKK